SWGPSCAFWLRARTEHKVEILTGTHIRSASEENGRVRLVVDGRGGVQEHITDHVIAATGYKWDLERLSYLDPELRQEIPREDKAAALGSNFETSVPGLFMVGMISAAVFGPVMRFMFGAKHAAPIVTSRLKSPLNSAMIEAWVGGERSSLSH